MSPTSAMVTSDKSMPSALVTFLEAALIRAGLQGCHVTSVARNVREQATAMLANLMSPIPDDQGRVGPAKQYAIYKDAGDQIVRVAQENWSLASTGAGRAKLIGLMMTKIEEVGRDKVSHHCLPMDSPLIVCDIRKNSVLNHARFEQAILGHPQVVKLLDENNVFHLEIYKEPRVTS